jgi:hypothetical protein
VRRGVRFGRLILTTLRTPSGSPVLDGAGITDGDGNWYGGYALKLPIARLSLAAGWRGAVPPHPLGWRAIACRLRPDGSSPEVTT